MADSVFVQMNEILDEYQELAEETVEKSSRKAAKDTAQRLKNTSPSYTGDYASGWTYKKGGKYNRVRGIGAVNGYIVHNRDNYQLTHLLEKGHVIKNKKGTYGRAPAHPHIAPAAEIGASEFEENIRRGLR